MEQCQHSRVPLVMTALLPYARPGELLRPGASTSGGFAELLRSPGTQTGLLLNGPWRPKLEKPVVVLHPSDFLPFFPESDNRLDVATGSTLPMETSWPVNRHSRRLPVVGASQKTRTMESHENFPTMREALTLRTKSEIPARKSPTASPALRRTACGFVARRPAHGSPGIWWPARMWTGDELTELSDFRSLARECKNGRLRAALVAPHVSQEPVVLKTLERFRLLRVLCLWSVAGLFSLNEILRR